MNRLLYDLEVEQTKAILINELKHNHENVEVTTEFLDRHNTTCPRCQKKLKVYNGTVKNIGTLSAFLFTERNKVYMYAICKDCVRKMRVSSRMDITHSKSAQDTEDYILGCLNE